MEHFAGWHALIEREEAAVVIEGGRSGAQIVRLPQPNTDEHTAARLETVKAQYTQAVPEDLARQSRPIGFGLDGKRLIVECDSSIVAQQLAFLAVRICEICKVENLRFRVKDRRGAFGSDGVQ